MAEADLPAESVEQPASRPDPSAASALPSVLGLIAGEGRFPAMVLEEAHRQGLRTVTLAIEGEAQPELENMASDAFHWVGLGQLSRCVKLFRDAGIERAIMAGRVRHVKAFQILRPDRLMLKILTRLSSRSPQVMLSTLADVFEEEGIRLMDSTVLLREHMARAGKMGRRNPSRAELADIQHGLKAARAIAELDAGQTVVVKSGAVVAMEALEGTDAAIRRAGELVSGPMTVVKVARPRQDMRFDVPVVGPNTIRSMKAAGGSAIALESGRVLLLEQDALLREADAGKIAVFGIGMQEE